MDWLVYYRNLYKDGLHFCQSPEGVGLNMCTDYQEIPCKPSVADLRLADDPDLYTEDAQWDMEREEERQGVNPGELLKYGKQGGLT